MFLIHITEVLFSKIFGALDLRISNYLSNNITFNPCKSYLEQENYLFDIIKIQ